MTTQENELLKRYDIKTEIKTMYLYGKYKYENFSDALAYAKLNKKNVNLSEASNDSFR